MQLRWRHLIPAEVLNMKQFILFSVSFLSVLAVASCFEILSRNLDPLNIEVTKLKCLSEGRFRHPYDCGGYVECVKDIKGTFKRRFGTCHGVTFSSKFKSCMLSTEDYECKRSTRNGRALATDQIFSSICSEVRNGFVCADCKTVVNCVEGVAYTESCGAGDMCAEKIEFGGAVCYPSQPDSCTCSTPNEFHVDNYNPHMFFYCDNTGSDPDLYHCPEDMQFDLESKQCKHEEGLPECTQTGNFATYDNCSQYYTCIFSRDGWVQKSFLCPNNLMYNEDTGECEDPCSWDTGEFICQEEGRFADPLSCQHYYECIQDEGEFRQDHRQCPDGYEWNTSALMGNGHCMKGHTNNCTTVKVSQCFIPEGDCSDMDPEVSTVPPFVESTGVPPVDPEISSQVSSTIADNAAPLPEDIDNAFPPSPTFPILDIVVAVPLPEDIDNAAPVPGDIEIPVGGLFPVEGPAGGGLLPDGGPVGELLPPVGPIRPPSPRTRLWSILNRGNRRVRRTVHISSLS